MPHGPHLRYVIMIIMIFCKVPFFLFFLTSKPCSFSSWCGFAEGLKCVQQQNLCVLKVQNCKSVLHCRIIICQDHHLLLKLLIPSSRSWSRSMSWTTVVLNTIFAGDMDRISTVSESVFKTTGSSPPTGGADLNSHMHNHVSRPTTSEAGVMAKAKKSVEEELELSTVVKSSKGFRIPSSSNKVKTNNFFKMMNNKTNVLTSPR